MIHLLFALAALSTWTDPGGDTYGAGVLSPPTAAVYSSLAPFDLTEVTWEGDETITLRVTLAATPNPGELPLGLSLAVVDIYLDTQDGGEEALLEGPGLRMPPGEGWNIAIRLTGDRAYARLAGDDTEYPVEVGRGDDGAFVIHTPFRAPERLRVHAMTGVYDPFRSDAWRPLSRSASPWAFSHPEGGPPVVDLLAPDDAAQRRALSSGVLPSGPTRPDGLAWFTLMFLGLGVAVAGVVVRQRASLREEPERGPAAGDAAPATSESGADADAAPESGPGLQAEAEPEADPEAEAAAETAPRSWLDEDANGWLIEREEDVGWVDERDEADADTSPDPREPAMAEVADEASQDASGDPAVDAVREDAVREKTDAEESAVADTATEDSAADDASDADLGEAEEDPERR